MSLKKYFFLLSAAAFAFPYCASAVALNSPPELAGISAINKSAKPRNSNQVIAIILQDKQNKPQTMRKAGGEPKPQEKSAKPPKGSGPGPQFLNPQPEPPNRQPPPDK
jgi:hypothetical protein